MVATPQILLNEKDLFAEMATGSEAAFTKIFYHYTQRIYNFIFSKTKSNEFTEEIVQEVFIKLWSKRADIDQVENYEAYIFTMATNKVYDFLRKMATEEKLKKQVWESMQRFSNVTNETVDLNHSQELINEATDRLTPQRKKIFILSKQQGLTRHEIANQLDLSVNTVDNHLNEAVRFVREYLQRTPGASFTLLMILMRINNH